MRGERLADVTGDLREHGQEGNEHARPRGRQGLRAAAQGEGGDGGEVARDEGGPPHRRGGDAGRLGDGLEHEAFREAHAHLAVDDALEEVPLGLRGTLRQLPESRLAQTTRPRAARLGHVAESLRDVGQRERCRR